MTLEAASHPPFGAGFNTYPRIEAFHPFECARDTEVTGGIGVACVHDPRSGQEWYINAVGVIERGSAPTAVVAISRGGGDDRFPEETDGVILSPQ